MNNTNLFANKAVLGGIAALALIAAAVGAGFLFGKTGDTASPSVTASAEGAAPTNICDAALARAQDYGVVPPVTSLTTTTAENSATAGRKICNAQAGEKTYSMSVDVTCDDMSDAKCLQIYSITQGDGTMLFHRQG